MLAIKQTNTKTFDRLQKKDLYDQLIKITSKKEKGLEGSKF